MQFKHPEILFALLLLIIPIIVHLFHLQRFVKVPFTNVKFLKKIEQQTRKSSMVKKWLILALRLLAFTSLILAFSQPYFSNQQKNTKTQTIIYLDNSLSMTYKIEGQEILNKSVQELIENFKTNEEVTLLTNDNLFSNLDQKSLKNTLLNLSFSPIETSFENIFIKINKETSIKPNTLSDVILISDYQDNKKIKKESVTNVNGAISLINVVQKDFKNIFIDSIYISKRTIDQVNLKVIISNINTTSENTSISLLNNTELIGKTSTPLVSNRSSEVEFSIPIQENFQGKLILQDENLQFDNSLFFNIEKPKKVNVISIGNPAPFLAKIYTKDDFNFQEEKLENLNFSKFKNQQLIILNEINEITNSLSSELVNFQKNGGTLVIIPSQNIDLNSYNNLFNRLNVGSISSLNEQELEINSINYEHPVLNGVFEKKVTNFQYPNIKSYYASHFNNISPIVLYQNNEVFAGQLNTHSGSLFWFSASLSTDNSTFQNSPLIVPLLYNIGKSSHKFPELYYTISKRNNLIVDTELKSDHVLKLSMAGKELIPLQQVFKNKVEINTFNEPSLPGHYDIIYNDQVLKKASFNYNRSQSILKYLNINELFDGVKNVTISNSIKQTMKELSEHQKINLLFRWFLGLTALFLLLEIAILKFFKI